MTIVWHAHSIPQVRTRLAFVMSPVGLSLKLAAYLHTAGRIHHINRAGHDHYLRRYHGQVGQFSSGQGRHAHIGGMRVDLRGKDAASAQLLERHTEATDACEELNERERVDTSALDRNAGARRASDLRMSMRRHGRRRRASALRKQDRACVTGSVAVQRVAFVR